MEKTQRKRFDGTPSQLCDALKKHVASRGKSFVRYDESAVVKDSKLQLEKIKAHKELLGILHNLSSGLHFKRTLLVKAFTTLAHECGDKLRLTSDTSFIKDWATTMSRRVMNMCHHVAQAMNKPTPPTWVSELPWNAAGDHDSTCAAVALVSASEVEVVERSQAQQGRVEHSPYREERAVVARVHSKTTLATDGAMDKSRYFPVRKDLGHVVRMPIDDEKARPEPASQLREPPEAVDASPMVAVWPDGMTREVPELTVMKWRLSNNTGGGKAEATVYWEGAHSRTHHRINVKRKTDRKRLMVIQEEDNLIVQVHVALLNHGIEDNIAHQA